VMMKPISSQTCHSPPISPWPRPRGLRRRARRLKASEQPSHNIWINPKAGPALVIDRGILTEPASWPSSHKAFAGRSCARLRIRAAAGVQQLFAHRACGQRIRGAAIAGSTNRSDRRDAAQGAANHGACFALMGGMLKGVGDGESTRAATLSVYAETWLEVTARCRPVRG